MTFISRILGLVRDVVIARFFGTTLAADAFFIAFKIPNLFRRLFAEGAFSAAFVPVLTEHKETTDEAAVAGLIDATFGTLALVLLVVVALGVLAAPVVITVFAPGFLQQADKLDLATALLRITFPYLLFVSLTALLSGVLNTYGRFAVPAFHAGTVERVVDCLCHRAGAAYGRTGDSARDGRVRRRRRAARAAIPRRRAPGIFAATASRLRAGRRAAHHAPDGAGDLRCLGGADQFDVGHVDRVLSADRQHFLAVVLGSAYGVSARRVWHCAGHCDPAEPIAVLCARRCKVFFPLRSTGRCAGYS